MKILITCDLPGFAIEELQRLGLEVVYQPTLGGAELASSLAGIGLLVVDDLPVTPEAVERATDLQMIICARSGVTRVALDQASAQGIFVTHCPSRDAIAQAEMSLGLLLALDRDVVGNAITLREGRWERGQFLQARGLAGRTLGMIGKPEFCRALASRARGFAMSLCGWLQDASPDEWAEHHVDLMNWPREVARHCDFAIVHMSAGEAQARVVDTDFLESLPVGACLVLVGEASAVDESAVERAVRQRNLKVALDVHDNAPTSGSGKIRSPLLQLPQVIGTHQIAGATEQARYATAREVVRIASGFLVAGELINCVNLCERSPATWLLVLRLRDQVGVMAAVLDAIRSDGINAEEITSRVFVGAKAAWCTIALDERPSAEAIAAIQGLSDVLHLELRAVV